jgi:hypothetical protein
LEDSPEHQEAGAEGSERGDFGDGIYNILDQQDSCGLLKAYEKNVTAGSV